MNRITQDAKKRQAVVRCAERKSKSFASRQYGVSLSSVKRWCKRYDGKWQSLKERSHRPNSHPARHTAEEEALIREGFKAKYYRYGWDGVYAEIQKAGYTRSLSGMIYAGKRMGLLWGEKKRKPPRKHDRKFPEQSNPGDKVQIDVKEVPYNCLSKRLKEMEKHMYQWTAIDECTRMRFVYVFYEHTSENTIKFFKMLQKAFPFKIKKIQTDNGIEFTYKYIGEDIENPFDTVLRAAGIEYVLIPPRTPWHNGKVERSHRNDQKYFYDREKFTSVEDLNEKLKRHLAWSNNKPMRILGDKSPLQVLKSKFQQSA